MGNVSFNISDFKANFKGGARAYLFRWKPGFPNGIDGDDNLSYLVRTTNFPEDTVEEIIVNWQGADLKMPGKRTFNDWTITVNTDRSANIRKVFIDWADAIHNLDTGEYGERESFEAIQELQMLDYNGDVIENGDIKLIGAWPKSVGAITLDYSSMDIAQFDITFGYLYHELASSS